VFRGALISGVSWLAGCATAQPGREQQLDRSFAEIQVQEAHISHAVAERRAECASACASSDRARSASARLCAIAREIADADALTRCERGREQASDLDADVGSRCRCEER
jgi:hypothetical protein